MCDSMCSNSLKCNNDKIVTCILDLRRLRDEVNRIIKKQEEEKTQLQMEMERLSYKLNNVSRGLAQRIIARDRYTEAITEAEEYYKKLVLSSEVLLCAVQKDFSVLNESMDKRVGPDNLSCSKDPQGRLKNCNPTVCGVNPEQPEAPVQRK